MRLLAALSTVLVAGAGDGATSSCTHATRLPSGKAGGSAGNGTADSPESVRFAANIVWCQADSTVFQTRLRTGSHALLQDPLGCPRQLSLQIGCPARACTNRRRRIKFHPSTSHVVRHPRNSGPGSRGLGTRDLAEGLRAANAGDYTTARMMFAQVCAGLRLRALVGVLRVVDAV